MKCKNCGSRIPNDSIFCPICDFRVAKGDHVTSGLDESLHDDYDPDLSGYEGHTPTSHGAESTFERYSCRHDENEQDFEDSSYQEEPEEPVRPRDYSVNSKRYTVTRTTSSVDINGLTLEKCKSQLVKSIVLIFFGGNILAFMAAIFAGLASASFSSGDYTRCKSMLRVSKILTRICIAIIIMYVIFAIIAFGIAGIAGFMGA